MIKKITIVSSDKHKGIKELQKEGSSINFEPEPENRKDPNAIKVICNNLLAGYVANKPSVMVEGTTPASRFKYNLNEETTAAVKSVKKEADNGKWITFTAEVELKVKKKDSGEKKKQIYELPLEGSQIMFPERTNALEAVKQNKEVPVSLKKTDRGIEAATVNDSIGLVKKSIDNYKEIENLVDYNYVSGVLSPASTIRSLKVLVDVTNDSSIFEEATDNLVLEGIMSSEQVKERIEYMRKVVKMDDKSINNILNSIEPVNEEDRGRLVNPSTKFVDYNGYLKESIVYITKNKFLRFVGGKATGKNTAADTLCWLFNRPKGEVAMNEGLDKVDLTGSRIIDSDEQGNMRMPFELSTFAEGLKKGWFLILDEVNTANPSLLTILHGLDSRRCIDIPGYGTIKVHPKACVILTMNEDYVGTMPLNEATVDRFTPIIFEDAEDISNILQAAVPSATEEHIEICQRYYKMLKDLYHDGKISSYAISIRGFIDALDVVNELGLKSGIETNVANKGIDRMEREVLKEELKLLFP